MTVAAAVATRDPSGSATPEGARIGSLDLWRGVVMVLMAIDHVRVYSGLPAGGPTAGIFFTRWVTHFCAPAFVFLAGTAAFLYGRKAGLHAMSRYLFTRGLALVLMEVTIIRLSWTFTLASLNSPLAGVIWMLGWCMVLMAGLVRLSIAAVTVVGLVLVFGQDIVGGAAGRLPFLGAFLYSGGEVQLGAAGPTFSILYTIIPWIGVMALGYAFGAIVVRPAEERHRAFVRIGVVATAAFLVLGGALVAFSPAGDGPPALFQLLNQRKYPASPVVPVDDPGPADCPAASGRAGARRVGGVVHDVRSRANVLLPAAHTGDSPARVARLEDPRWSGPSRVVCVGSVRVRASGAALEPRAALPRVRRLDPGSLLSVPVVRGSEEAEQQRAAPLRLNRRRLQRLAAHGAGRLSFLRPRKAA